MSGISGFGHISTNIGRLDNQRLVIIRPRVQAKLEVCAPSFRDSPYATLKAGVYRVGDNAFIYGDDPFIYNTSLMALEPEEFRLNAGRFSRFLGGDVYVSEESIIFKGSSFTEDWYPGATVAFPNGPDVEELVSWTSENTEKQWTMTVVPHHVSMLEISFAFEYYVDAVHFAMRWR